MPLSTSRVLSRTSLFASAIVATVLVGSAPSSTAEIGVVRAADPVPSPSPEATDEPPPIVLDGRVLDADDLTRAAATQFAVSRSAVN